jgi:hypothetical protein
VLRSSRRGLTRTLLYTRDLVLSVKLILKHPFYFCGKRPRSRCYGRTAALRLIVQSCVGDDQFFLHFYKSWSSGGMKLSGGKPKYSGGRTVPLKTEEKPASETSWFYISIFYSDDGQSPEDNYFSKKKKCYISESKFETGISKILRASNT